MKFFNFFTRKKDEDADYDWRDLDALPKEIVSEKELDAMQDEVVKKLTNLEQDTIKQAGDIPTAKPQALFYCHKYIDAKFNKEYFDIDTYFSRKQNIVDQKYAEGLGDIKAEFTGYRELIEEIKEVDWRLRKKINKLDPSSNVNLDVAGTYDDSEALLEQINELPAGINWNNFEKENE